MVEQFKYLGSLVEVRGGEVGKVRGRISQASRAYGSLRDSVFTASHLTMETKRMVYYSVVLGVLRYGAETWALSRIWLVNWTVSTDTVFIVFWV